MKQLLTFALIVSSLVVVGCDSNGGTRVVPKPAAAAPNSFQGSINNNPNIPDAAKKAMLGNQAH